MICTGNWLLLLFSQGPSGDLADIPKFTELEFVVDQSVIDTIKRVEQQSIEIVGISNQHLQKWWTSLKRLWKFWWVNYGLAQPEFKNRYPRITGCACLFYVSCSGTIGWNISRCTVSRNTSSKDLMRWLQCVVAQFDPAWLAISAKIFTAWDSFF